MPQCMRSALDNVKDLFKEFPDASVRLKNTSRIGLSTGSYYGEKQYYPGRYCKSSLIFNLDKDCSKKAKQFTIESSEGHTSKLCFSRYEDILSMFPKSTISEMIKDTNIGELTEKITKENIKKGIETTKELYA